MNGIRDHGRRRRCMRHHRAKLLAAVGAWIGSALLLSAALPAQTDWMRVRVLEPRADTAMTYDAARQRVVLFGGNGGSGTTGDTWLHGNLVPAAAQRFGTACAGTNGPPPIASNLPFLGNQGFILDLFSARALAPCLFMLAPQTQALNVGGSCTLYLRGVFLTFFTAADASGHAIVKFSIPLDPSLRGGTAYAQGFVVDPMGSFAGFAFSAGLKLVLGD